MSKVLWIAGKQKTDNYSITAYCLISLFVSLKDPYGPLMVLPICSELIALLFADYTTLLVWTENSKKLFTLFNISLIIFLFWKGIFSSLFSAFNFSVMLCKCFVSGVEIIPRDDKIQHRNKKFTPETKKFHTRDKIFPHQVGNFSSLLAVRGRA